MRVGREVGREVGWVVLLPLYLAMAASLGFVDQHVRAYPAHAYETYVPEVTSGEAAPPARYRVLAPALFAALRDATGWRADTAWIAFRFFGLLGSLLAGHVLFRTWFGAGSALGGNALVFALLPLTFTNSWGHPDHLVELLLFTLGLSCAARGQTGAFVVVLALAAFNRETSFLLLPIWALARPFTAAHVRTTVAVALVWGAVFAGLRWTLGYVAYDPWQLANNVGRLFAWPAEAADRDLYSRLYAWFFVAMLAGPAVLIGRTWARQPRVLRGAAGVAAPLFLAVGVLFSSVIEPRIFTPLLPIAAAGVLTALNPPRHPL